MSTPTFDINSYYRDTVERDQWDLSDPVIWNNSGNVDLSVQAVTVAPAWRVFVSELRILDRSLSGTFTVADSGFFDITFPTYDGSDEIVKSIKSIDDLAALAGDKIISIGSNTLYVVEFKPRIILVPTYSKSTFKVSKNANLSAISSGSLIFRTKGWRMLETDYL